MTTLIAQSELFTAPLRSVVESPNYGGNLMKVGATWGAEATIEEVDRGLPAERVMLSADGRHWIDGWHRGPETGQPVYVEQHTCGGAVFHGWIDSISRLIVQTG